MVGMPDERWGEVPAAFVRLVPGAEADEAELIAWVRAGWPPFKAPQARSSSSTSCPKGGTGKLQKQVLRAWT